MNETVAAPFLMQGLTPDLVCDGAAAAIEFYKKAFDKDRYGFSWLIALNLLHHLAPGPGGVRVMAALMRW